MLNQFSRTELLLGHDGMEKLYGARVAVFGIGGVGGYTVEALARSGVGTLDLIDDDKVCLTNLNRQIIATRSTVGKYKVDVAAERIHDINPDAVVNTYKTFYNPETASQFDFTQYDYVVDAIDTVTGKIELVEQANKAGTPIISCMGAGNKLNAAAFEVSDIYKTSFCPLARVMRYELRRRGIKKLKVVYSREQAMTPIDDMASSCRQNCICPPGTARKCTQRRQVPGSTAFVPAAAGLIVAGEVVKGSFRACTTTEKSKQGTVGRENLSAVFFCIDVEFIIEAKEAQLFRRQKKTSGTDKIYPMERDFTTGNVFRNIIYYSIPYLLAYFLQTLYGMADLFIIGQFEGVAATTAVSIGSTGHAHGDGHAGGARHGHHGPASRGPSARSDREEAAHGIGNTVTLFMSLSLVLTARAAAVCPSDRRRLISTPGGGRRRHGGLSDHLLRRHPVHHGI